MIPIVALIGRQNVGKSTLFNCLTRTRDALVANFPGLTRDRQYGYAEIAGKKFIIIDTGGIHGAKDGIETLIKDQALVAIEEADIVLFIMDARAGLISEDKDIALYLRSAKKKIFLVCNKIDGVDEDSAIAEFYALGFEKVYPISASHGLGVTSLLEEVLFSYNTKQDSKLFEFSEKDTHIDYWSKKLSKNTEIECQTADFCDSKRIPIKLAIVGRPNVGKSTLINFLLGEKRVIVYDMPGTTRDTLYVSMERYDRKYILIDTAGVRKRGKITETVEKFSVIKTLKAIENANVVLLVIDSCEGILDQDLSLLGIILNTGRSLVIALNKWDGLSLEIKKHVQEMIERRLGFIDFARVHFISALHGNGVDNLFKSINEAYISATKRVSTAIFTRLMHLAAADHKPPLVRGRRVKLKYAHAGGYNPPIIVVHGNQVKDLPDHYKRYLINYYRRSLKIKGAPIRILFKEGENPFANKRNTLTPKQSYKRKRLITYIKKDK